MLSVAYCHICGAITDPEYICTQCDENVCEDCMVKMTIHNQIDYCLCENCHDGNNNRKASHFQKIEAEKKVELKIKKEKAFKRWQKYHSAPEIEKRKLKRIALLKLRQERAIESAKRMAEIMKDLFKYM